MKTVRKLKVLGIACASITAGLAIIGPRVLAQGATPGQACAAGDGGLSLPQGFCATVFADGLGHVRHLAVAPNGTVYANTWSGRYYHNKPPPAGGFLLALRDSKGNGQADQVVRFGPTAAQGNAGGTGLKIANGFIYAETNDRIVRYRLPASGLAPTDAAQTVVSGLPLTGDHPMHPMAVDGQGKLYIDMGSATNACQRENRIPDSPGIDPCTELRTRGGIWRYDANRLDQHFSPAERFVTGLRNSEGISIDSTGRMFATQHGRDQLFQNWPHLYNPAQGAAEPAEELVRLQPGGDYGWPACYFDDQREKLVLAPEYGGDGGKTIGVCAQKLSPVAAFPGHWAPNDMVVYQGSQFPSGYKDGAFIAFHGSWNRAPLPQGGYNVVFQPMKDGKAAGAFVVFADGFAGGHMEPGRAAHRPTGLAVGPHGSLYVADDQGGRIWRITYQGGEKNMPVAAAISAPATASAANSPMPPEGIHPDAGLPVPPGGSPDQIALGDKIFHGQLAGGTCAGCHGSDGKGSSNGSNLADNKWAWSDGSVQGIVTTIRNGVAHPKDHVGNMPPSGGVQLSQGDVTALGNYVWALSHAGR